METIQVLVTESVELVTIIVTERIDQVGITVSEAQKGSPGNSAYKIAVDAGYKNSEYEFAADLNSISNKVDKVEGKGLSTEDYTSEEKTKLSGIAENANNYQHPSTHPASMIEESTERVFVSSDEKAKIHDPNSDNSLKTPDKSKTVAYTDNAGNLHVSGSIYQQGEAYETHQEQVYTRQDEIITRDGAEAGLGANEYTGIRAKNYDGLHDGRLVFDREGIARVGDVGDEQPLATREEAPVDGGLAYFDALTLKFKTLAATVKQGYDSAVNWISNNGQNLLSHAASTENPHAVTKTQVGLGNVDNTSDADKPVSSAQALGSKQDRLLQTLSDADNIDWNAELGSAAITLSGARTMNNPTNLVAGGRYVLIVKQDAIGSRTLAFSSYYKFPGAVIPVLTSTALAVDVLEFIAESASILRLTNFIPDSK